MEDEINGKLQKFSRSYGKRSYRKGDMVIRGDDEPLGVYLIKSGIVKMSIFNEDGEELAVNIFKPGTFFPMPWAIGGAENRFYFQTLSPSLLVRIPKAEFVEFLKANPDVLFDLTRRLLVGLDGLLFDLSRILSGSSTSKIAVVIYMLAMRFGVKNGAEIEIGLALPHQEIAHFAGLTRETTTIAIDKLVKDGIIVQRKRRIIVKDLKALKNGF